MSLEQKIKSKEARIAILGLGYVGLPLAVSFAESGFTVLGFDVNQGKVSQINQGKSYILDISHDRLEKLVTSKKFQATSDIEDLKGIDCVSICVPTPLRKTKDPDISYIVKSVEGLAKFIHQDQLIVLESTTYPGTTEEVVLPVFEEKGLKVGKDFFLAFSPERIDPSNQQFTTENIPKVVGGVTPKCTKMAALYYGQIISEIVPVSSSKVAEMIKLLENTFRAVNIALANEIAILCRAMDIDVWEVIDGAATKPFGFMPFYPGPGLGGHCLPVDPIYLSWKAKLIDFEARFIDLAAHINSRMPAYVVEVTHDALNQKEKSFNGSKILLLGIAYKKNVGDTRESPALDVWELLEKKGVDLCYHDPYVKKIKIKSEITSVDLTAKLLKEIDCVLVLTDHDEFDYAFILEHTNLLIDTRNATKNIKKYKEKIVKI